jgi:3-phosphoshikimate 1-carboxyvinyltransferase
MHADFLDPLPIDPLERPPDCSITPPGSKSITNRALPLAAMSLSPIRLRGWLDSDDTRVMMEALRRLGHRVELGHELTVGNGPPPSEAGLFVGNSGTTIRFLAAQASLLSCRTRLDGVPRMRQRPIGGLISALAALGVDARCADGFPPVEVVGGGWRGGEVTVPGDESSQFLSGLLLAAPFAPTPTTFRTAGPLVSRPYVDLTVQMLRQYGVTVDEPAPGTFHVPAPQAVGLPGGRYDIEPDASSASYFLAAAAVTGGRVTIPGLTRWSLQGDAGFVDVLEAMGCRVGQSPLEVWGGSLRGIEADLNGMSDLVMTLASVAVFAEGPTEIRNVAHIRHKESDRLAAVARELGKLGAKVEELPDGLRITPRPLRGAALQTYDDHRMAMSLAVVGLRLPGVSLHGAGCVHKTYPGFFRDLQTLRHRVTS